MQKQDGDVVVKRMEETCEDLNLKPRSVVIGGRTGQLKFVTMIDTVQTKTGEPHMPRQSETAPDVGDWLHDLRDAMHLYKGRDITQRAMESRLSKLGDKMEGFLRSVCAHEFEEKSCHIGSWKECKKCGDDDGSILNV